MKLLILAVLAVTATANPRVRFMEKELIKRGFGKEEAKAELRKPELTAPLAPVDEEHRTWNEFVQLMLSPKWILAGAAFKAQHLLTLQSAHEEYKIAPEILVGLTMVETMLGSKLGPHEAYKLLYKKALNGSKKRWKPAAIRFAALAGYCKKTGRDCFALRGSWEGAIGLVQFMPDTLENLGVDGNGDQDVDLFNPEDALPSAARFLNRFGGYINPKKALSRYYGSPKRYPDAVLKYAGALGWQPLAAPVSVMAKAKPKTVLVKTNPKTQRKKPARRASRVLKFVIGNSLLHSFEICNLKFEMIFNVLSR